MENVKKEKKLYCPNCGSENSYQVDYCFCCGSSLKEAREKIEQSEKSREDAARLKKEALQEPKKASKKSILLPPLALMGLVLLAYPFYLRGEGGDFLESAPSEALSAPTDSLRQYAEGLEEEALAETNEALDEISEVADPQTEAAEAELAIVPYKIELSSVDYAAYPSVAVSIRVSSEEGAPVGDIDVNAIKAQCQGNLFELASVENEGNGYYGLLLNASLGATVPELMVRQELSISIDPGLGECRTFINPGEEMMAWLMPEYHQAYIEDINSHTMNRILDYVETDVDYDDHSALMNQMRTEISGGFLNSLAQSLQSCEVTDIYPEDENTFHVNVTVKIDGVFEEPYEVWTWEDPSVASAIKQFLGTVSNDMNIRISSFVTEYCEYLVRKSEDGSYKILRYTGDISLAKKWQVYNAIVVS